MLHMYRSLCVGLLAYGFTVSVVSAQYEDQTFASPTGKYEAVISPVGSAMIEDYEMPLHRITVYEKSSKKVVFSTKDAFPEADGRFDFRFGFQDYTNNDNPWSQEDMLLIQQQSASMSPIPDEEEGMPSYLIDLKARKHYQMPMPLFVETISNIGVKLRNGTSPVFTYEAQEPFVYVTRFDDRILEVIMAGDIFALKVQVLKNGSPLAHYHQMIYHSEFALCVGSLSIHERQSDKEIIRLEESLYGEWISPTVVFAIWGCMDFGGYYLFDVAAKKAYPFSGDLTDYLLNNLDYEQPSPFTFFYPEVKYKVAKGSSYHGDRTGDVVTEITIGGVTYKAK
jgi:hypothetical protein